MLLFSHDDGVSRPTDLHGVPGSSAVTHPVSASSARPGTRHAISGRHVGPRLDFEFLNFGLLFIYISLYSYLSVVYISMYTSVEKTYRR